MARTRTSAAPDPGTSFAPDDPVLRALHLVKGEGRRCLLLGLGLELTGELLPDLLPGEVEAARVIWSLLPGEARNGSLPRDAGLFRFAWEEAIALDREDEEARSAAVVTAIFLGNLFHRGLADLVDALYDAYRAETALEGGLHLVARGAVEDEADGSENVEEAGGVAAAEGGALAAKGCA